MELGLRGKRVLITGSTSGIGKEMARQFLKEGAEVIVSSFSAQEVEATIAELKALGTVHGAVGDLGTTAGAQTMIAQAETFGALDILICNLGVNTEGDFADVTDEQWLRAFNLNVMSAVRVCRHYLPQMLTKGEGRILLASSACGLEPMGNKVEYSVMKTAILGLGRALAELTRGTAVTVNSILPGPTLTEGVEKMLGEDKQAGEKAFFAARPSSLLGRFLTMEELARMYLFYASPLSCAANGASIRADGGMIRSIG